MSPAGKQNFAEVTRNKLKFEQACSTVTCQPPRGKHLAEGDYLFRMFAFAQYSVRILQKERPCRYFNITSGQQVTIFHQINI
jgi:hypothetical protein